MSEDDGDLSGSFRFPKPPEVTYYDALGRRRTFAGLGLQEWAFLVVSGVNFFIAIGLTVERLVKYCQIPDSPDFTYSLLLLISALFCVLYVLNGLLREHQYEIYAFVAAMTCVLSYCVFEYIFNIRGRNPIKLIRMIIGCVLAPLNIFLALRVAKCFGWLEFRIVGAAEGLLGMYRQVCFFFSLQKFDSQAAVSFLILVLRHGTTVGLEQILSLSIGLPLLCFTFFLGLIAVQREINFLVWIFALLSLAEPIYILYKLTEVYLLSGTDEMGNSLLEYSTLCVGMLALLVRCIMVFELRQVYRNFGYGLKEKSFVGLVSNETTGLIGRQRPIRR